MKKKICRIPLSWLLTITMFTAIIPPAVSAEETAYEVNGVYYTVTDNTATVTGCADDITSLQVEDVVGGCAVTSVKAGAFKGKSALESVKIADSVTFIGEYAFSDCENLSDIILPAELQNTGRYLFSGCTSLTEVILPDKLNNLAEHAFAGCTALKEVTFPASIDNSDGGHTVRGEWFEGCTALEKVTFADGATRIPPRAFVDCKEIELVIPDTLKSIGFGAFSGVEWIDNIDFIPEGVETIEKSAFADCPNLKSATLPKSAVSVFSEVFRGCTALEEVSIYKNVLYSDGPWFEGCTLLSNVYIEDGTTVIPEGMFSRLPQNMNIVIPESVKTIQASAFEGSTVLTSIDLPSGLEVISEKAFLGCTGLKSVYIPRTVRSINENSFAGCADDLVIYCADNAVVADELAAADIYHVYNGRRTYNNLIPHLTGYYADGSSMLTRGYITLTAKYQINTAVAENPDPAELKITIPGDCRVRENAVYVNSVPVSSYSVSGNVLSVTGLPSSATVSVILSKEGARDIISRASLTFWSRNTGYVIQTIGTTCEPVRTVSVVCDPYTNDGNVKITGIATPETKVKLYVDGEYFTETVSNKAGSYKSMVTIANPENGKSYIIKAVIGDDESNARETTVTYNPDMPSLISAYLYTNNHMNPGEKIDLTHPGKIQTVEFWPVSSYTFEVKYTNPDVIEKVIITSIKGGDIKSIEAYYNEEKDAFISDKIFEPNNPYYVPGDIEIKFVEKIKYTREELKELAEKLKDYIDSIKGEYLIKYDETIDPATGNLSAQIAPVGSNDWSNLGYTGTYDPGFDPEALGTKPFIDAYNGLTFLSNVVKKANGDEFRKMIIHDMNNNMTYTVDFAIDAIFGTSIGNKHTILDTVEITKIVNDIKNNLKNSNNPNKDEKLGRVDELYGGYVASAAAAIGIGMIGGASMAVGTTSAAFIAFCFICGAIVNAIIREFSAEITGSDDGIISRLRWLIDPSGYVYEGVTSNRISGATVTVYYKDSETGESVVWDAENYDQINPLVTNGEGRYSWVVPEGEWMVKCEMEGYDTVFTEWLPVPPPQMDVNIGLVSKAVPFAEITEAAGNKVKVVFSKYMIPETLETVEFTNPSGEVLNYSVSYPAYETDADGNVLAKAYTFEFDNELDGSVILKLDDRVKSYADVSAEAEEISIPVKDSISEITAPEIVKITNGGSSRVKLNVSGYNDVTITAESDMPSVALVGDITGSADDGAFYAVINTYSEGEAQITFKVRETGEIVTTTVCAVSEKEVAVKEVVKSEDDTVVHLINKGADEISGSCIIAVYDNDGKLVNTSIEPFESSENEITVLFDGFVPETENYKIMIIKDLSMFASMAYTY